MNPEVTYTKQRFQAYFAHIVEICRKYPPPGMNAANGWVRESMVSDPTIRALGGPPTLGFTDQNARDLFSFYMDVYIMTQRAFNENGNAYAHWGGNIDLLKQIFAKYGGAVVTIISGIISAASQQQNRPEQGAPVPQQQNQDAEKQIADGLMQLMNEMTNGKRVVFNGAHANGWISVYMQTAAREPFNRWSGKLTGDADRVFQMVKAGYQKIEGLDISNHKPWLRPEWQISFQGVMESTAYGLSTLN